MIALIKNFFKNKSRKIVVYLFLIGLGFAFVGPMLFALLSSVKDNKAIFDSPFGLPDTFLFKNYLIAWTEGRMGTYFLNSVIISVSVIVLTVFIASMAAFALSRFNLKFKSIILLFFLTGLMVPRHTILVPLAYIIGALKLKNNLFALILLYVAFALPFSIVVLQVFMKSINNSIIEAAIIDGAGYFRIYYSIVLPMTIPAISTISIFNFLGAWNDILFPLIIINDNNLKPIALGLLNFNGERGSQYGPLMAAIIITIIIPVILYLLFQEKVESGIAAGSVKE